MMLAVRLLLWLPGIMLIVLGVMLIARALSRECVPRTVALALLGLLLFTCGFTMIVLGGIGLTVLFQLGGRLT